jgi:hypothetical protein
MSNIISFILILASAGLFFGYVDPLYSGSRGQNVPVNELSIKELSQKRVEYDTALYNSKELQAEKEKKLNKYNEVPEKERERLEKLIPDNIDNVRLIIDIDEMAASHGMKIRNFKTVTDDAKDTVGADNRVYGTLTLTFSTSATYPTFLTFIKDLERSLRLIDITSVTFAAGEGSIYDYNVTVKTYWLK